MLYSVLHCDRGLLDSNTELYWDRTRLILRCDSMAHINGRRQGIVICILPPSGDYLRRFSLRSNISPLPGPCLACDVETSSNTQTHRLFHPRCRSFLSWERYLKFLECTLIQPVQVL